MKFGGRRKRSSWGPKLTAQWRPLDTVIGPNATRARIEIRRADGVAKEIGVGGYGLGRARMLDGQRLLYLRLPGFIKIWEHMSWRGRAKPKAMPKGKPRGQSQWRPLDTVFGPNATRARIEIRRADGASKEIGVGGYGLGRARMLDGQRLLYLRLPGFIKIWEHMSWRGRAKPKAMPKGKPRGQSQWRPLDTVFGPNATRARIEIRRADGASKEIGVGGYGLGRARMLDGQRLLYLRLPGFIKIWEHASWRGRARPKVQPRFKSRWQARWRPLDTVYGSLAERVRIEIRRSDGAAREFGLGGYGVGRARTLDGQQLLYFRLPWFIRVWELQQPVRRRRLLERRDLRDHDKQNARPIVRKRFQPIGRSGGGKWD